VERGLAASTVESYRRDLRRYASVLARRGKTGLDEISPADVAVSSAARAVIAVRGLHAFAVAQGLAGTDPAREVQPPAPPRRLPKAITIEDVERLLDAAGPGPDDLSAEPRLLRDRALLEFLYGTGARISEATGLDVDELQLDADPVVRLIGKGGKHRVVRWAATPCERSRRTSSGPGPAWPEPPAARRRAPQCS
jgi:integrase/recombinase XerD